MPPRSYAEKEAKAREKQAKQLAPVLVAFFEAPTDQTRATDWLDVLKENYPLWSLQRSQYTPYHNPRRLLDIAWHAMSGPSSNEWVRPYSEYVGSLFGQNRWKQPPLADPPWVGPELPPSRDELLPAFVQEAHRHTLLEGAIPFEPGRFTFFWETVSKEDLAPPDSDDETAFELSDETPIEKMRSLLWQRATSPNTSTRKAIQQEIDDYLEELGLTRTVREAVPKKDQLFRAIGTECRLWLAILEASNLNAVDLTDEAEAALVAWSCGTDDRWRLKLAFPFLSFNEIDVLLTSVVGLDVIVTAALMVHARFPLYEFSTVASVTGARRLVDLSWKDKPNPFL